MATPIKWGSEFLANTISTPGGQAYSNITKLADGRFVVMWTDFFSKTLGDNDGYAVHGQIFNADGSKAGAEFLVNTTTTGSQYWPVITGLTNGGFGATWIGDNGDIYRQIFNPDGSKQGDEVLVNDVTAGQQYSQDVAGLSGGGFVVAWTDTSGAGFDVYVQVFTAGGGNVSGEVLVHPASGFDRLYPTVTGLTGGPLDGGFVVAWQADTGSKEVVRLQMFDANGGKVGGELAATQFVTTDQTDASITALANGRFVVAWSHDKGNPEVHGQIFNANGTRSGSEFVLDTTANATAQVDITALPDGRFVATYTEFSAGNAVKVLGQLFDADGAKSGSEFLVSTPIDGLLSPPSVTALADGRFVVAWTDQLGSPGAGIHAQIFDPREGGVDITGTNLNDDLIGTNFDDTMKGGGGSDHLAGMGGPDTFDGGAGDDSIDGGGGDDNINGGAGNDTAVFSHGFNDHTVQDFGAKIVVIGPDGTDTATSIEHLQFSDVTINPADYRNDGNPLFDTLYYLSRNADVFQAGVNALDHFNTFGWHEGRDPNALFDTSGYVANNPNVKAAGINPLEHYHQTGWHEGRDPGAWFDTKLYLVHNPDVAAAGIDPLEHYLQYGMAEGRLAYEAIGEKIVGGFDAEWYLFNNPDVAAAGVDPLQHYNQFGWHEGRNPNAYFDTAGYLSHYGDVAAAGVNPLEHYMQFGWKEGRDASTFFDTAGYLAANPDVAAAGVNPFEHYLQFGIYEGRQLGSDGMWG